MTQAAALAQSGDTVLLAPACASFDMFQDFEDLVDQFKAAVRGMPPPGLKPWASVKANPRLRGHKSNSTANPLFPSPQRRGLALLKPGGSAPGKRRQQNNHERHHKTRPTRKHTGRAAKHDLRARPAPHRQPMDSLLLWLTFLLLGVGIVSVYDASYAIAVEKLHGNSFHFVKMQAGWASSACSRCSGRRRLPYWKWKRSPSSAWRWRSSC